jgi:hypothetical protein
MSHPTSKRSLDAPKATKASIHNLSATGHAGIRNSVWARGTGGVADMRSAAGIALYLFHEISRCPVAARHAPVEDPARFEWNDVTKVSHYYLTVDALSKPMRVCEQEIAYSKRGT